jgi:hypothetical protein
MSKAMRFLLAGLAIVALLVVSAPPPAQAGSGGWDCPCGQYCTGHLDMRIMECITWATPDNCGGVTVCGGSGPHDPFHPTP